jgi:ADP-heptose:LPS heptosyltransferase
MRPEKMVVKFARAAGGTGEERPNLKYMVNSIPSPEFAELLKGARSPYLCVMPGSRWQGKRWPVAKFAEAARNSGYFPVILGGPDDRESYELVRLMIELGAPHLAAIGKWSLSEVGRILAGSAGYLGNDTGLAHLAEAVGVPSTVVFGPTVPEMGFGPWRAESKTVGKKLWCRPCGKDGRSCYRKNENRFLCMSSLEADEVLARLRAPR